MRGRAAYPARTCCPVPRRSRPGRRPPAGTDATPTGSSVDRKGDSAATASRNDAPRTGSDNRAAMDSIPSGRIMRTRSRKGLRDGLASVLPPGGVRPQGTERDPRAPRGGPRASPGTASTLRGESEQPARRRAVQQTRDVAVRVPGHAPRRTGRTSPHGLLRVVARRERDDLHARVPCRSQPVAASDACPLHDHGAVVLRVDARRCPHGRVPPPPGSRCRCRSTAGRRGRARRRHGPEPAPGARRPSSTCRPPP